MSNSFFDYVVVRAGDVRREEWVHRMAVELAEFMVERWLRNHSIHWKMVELYECLGGWFSWGVTILQWQEARERLRQTLIEAFRREILVVLYEEHPQGYLPPRQTEPAPAMPERTTAWIALRLEDEDGDPLPEQRCRLTLSNGSVREGISGTDGTIRIENIPQAPCEVTFQKINEADWRRA